MKKIFMAVIALMMTISASAQFYIYYSDGTVAKVDSISLVGPDEDEDPNPSQGIGVFSVAEDKQVTFSPGNLQYHPVKDKWEFAPSQLDYIGGANSNVSNTLNAWIDLFGWSTRATYFGVSASDENSYYSGSFVDWGTNQIGNDAPNTWRTLTHDEWEYLLNTRTNASSLKGVAQVDGVNGLILLPDNWDCPSGVTFKSGFSNDSGTFGQYQTFTTDQWLLMENTGAVFLPAAGARAGVEVFDVRNDGSYWSATKDDYWDAYFFSFGSRYAEMDFWERYTGSSVRLVKDL